MIKKTILLTALFPLVTWGESTSRTESLNLSEQVTNISRNQSAIYPPDSIINEYQTSDSDFSTYGDDDDDDEYQTKKVNKRFFSWSTPWFAEIGSGIAMTTAGDTGKGSSLGNETSVAIGCWASPAFGLRLSANSTSTKWKAYSVSGNNNEVYTGKFNAYYFGGKIEALLNPLAIESGLKWNSNYGMFIAAGVGYGTMRKYDVEENFISTNCTSINFGVNIWSKIGDNLHFFVEPHFVYNFHKGGRTDGESNFCVNLGVSMNLHNPAFRCANHCKGDGDEEYPIMFCRSWDIGAGGGFITLQRRSIDYGGDGMNWSGSVFADYHFNNMFSLRANFDFTHISNNNPLPFYVDGSPETKWGMWQVNTKQLFASLNPEWNITNIFGMCHEDDNKESYSRGPKFEISAFAGPAVNFQLSQKYVPCSNAAVNQTPAVGDSKKVSFGFDGGVKLTHRLFAGLSVFFTPTWYFFVQDRDDMTAKTVSFGKLHMYQTYTLGIQYRLERLRIDFNSVRRLLAKHGAKDTEMSAAEKKRLRSIIKRHRE